MPEETKDLQKAGPTSMARPEFFKQGDTRGTEHITSDDLQMPRLALAQALSPQVNPGDTKYIKGLAMGMLFNDLEGRIVPSPVEFTVVRADPPRYIEFNPRESGGGVKDFNVSPHDPRTKFGPNGEKPIATKFHDFVIMMLPSRELIGLSLKSTGLKAARQLNGLMKVRQAPCYAGKYTLTTGTATNPKGTFAVYQIRNSETVDEATSVPGWVSQEVAEYAEGVFNSLRNKNIVMQREDADHTGGAEDGDANFDTSRM